MRWMPAFAGMTVMVLAFSAFSQQPQLTEQQKFLVGCNPQDKPELQKVCACLLENIEVAMTVKAFNDLEARELKGELSAVELDQKADLLRGRKGMIETCIRR
jgi:hypothetical protein